MAEAWPSHADTLSCQPDRVIAGPRSANTIVSTPIAASSPPDSSAGPAIRRRHDPTRTLTPQPPKTRERPQSRLSHTRARTASGATIPATYATPTVSATGNEAAAPASAATPASTGAQQALAAPENTPRL